MNSSFFLNILELFDIMVPSRIFSHIASIDFVMWRVFGSIFQCLGPATGKRLSPYDLVFYFGMTRIF